MRLPDDNQKSKVNKDTLMKRASPHAPYPFTAIVGQEEMKLALILNVVDPLIGGVLIMGHRGTGKSTAVRALADLLPGISVVVGCPFNCDPKDERTLCADCRMKIDAGSRLSSQLQSIPVVELPLGATEDRVCGTIAIERALQEGVKTFEPGVLARANRGFLYIDEVNLLEDHLVDLLLDVAASGWNKVEREGVSVEHPAQFVLIGSGNPEEGELRPQLLDRFGLHAEVKTGEDLTERITVVERREAYDRNADSLRMTFASKQEDLRKRIVRARRTFTKVKIDRSLLRQIVKLCVELKIDGHRGELTLMRASRALAALEARKKVTKEDVARLAPMCLRHRLRRNAFDETASEELVKQALEQVFNTPTPGPKDERFSQKFKSEDEHPNGISSTRAEGKSSRVEDAREFPSPPAHGPTKLRMDFDAAWSSGSGHFRSGRNVGNRTRHNTPHHRGRHTRSVNFKVTTSKVALAATLQALAALGCALRNGATGKVGPVDSETLRYKLFTHKQGTLFVFVIDASGSMATKRIAIAKRVILERLKHSYVNRDSVAVISFRGESAQLALPPSRSILRARRVLDSLTMGGGTPLAAGLASTLRLVLAAEKKQGETIVLLFTDGHANVALSKEGKTGESDRQKIIDFELEKLGVAMMKTKAQVVVVDTQLAFESSEDSADLAKKLDAKFFKLSA